MAARAVAGEPQDAASEGMASTVIEERGPVPAPGAGDQAPDAATPAPQSKAAAAAPPPAVNGAAPTTPAAHDAGAEAVGADPVKPSETALGLPPLQIHAFGSQGAIKSTKNNYLVNSKRGSVEFTEAGINFTQILTDRLRWGTQLFVRQLGKDGDYRARVDWFYLDYRFADWLGLRAGRTKMPFGLYNDVSDVDAARVPVLLPQAVYPILNRDFLLALTGAELYGYLRLGGAGALEYRLYGGTLYVDTPVPPPGLTLLGFEVPYLVGGRLFWETPVDGLRVGGNAQWLRINETFGIPGMAGMPATPLEYDLPFFLWLASAEYAAHDLIVAGEYGRWRADLELTGAPTTQIVNERFYGMAAYRLTPWFMPGAYYSSLTTNIHVPNTRDNYQRDWALTLRFDINSFWLVKLEGHFINGTTDLSPALNGNTPLGSLPSNWLLFLAKTTVYF
ncbi:MAG TPA: hypothetical protein VGP07_13010 [Polyangia bacterium]